MGYEENEPQINADERRFVASNPSLLIGSWVLAPYLFLSFSCVVASPTYRRVEFYGFGVIILEDRQCNSFSKTIAFNLRLSAFICGSISPDTIAIMPQAPRPQSLHPQGSFTARNPPASVLSAGGWATVMRYRWCHYDNVN
ncbi:MAG: hypothetical protein KKA10_00490 [Euryarchaeota archaeon]|nr:hypothetical protein [Euryarchaeota archaeon]MBU4454375.1 hypothetical protein [Euryarchaeota archaeon]MCG2737467.1 hypothetical protein [Candidatus Methanoperedenaceae archaeon]